INVIHGRIGKTLALRLNDPGGHADDGRVCGNALEDDGIPSDLHVVTAGNPSKDLGPGADHYVIAQRRMALPALLSRATERYSLKERDVIPDFSGFPNHHSHAVINAEPGADAGGRRDLDSGQPASHLGNGAGYKWNTVGL